MEEQSITKMEMTRRMETNRRQLNRLLDPENDRIQLDTLYKVALASGKSLTLRELVREVCLANEIEILQGSVCADHVHVLLSCPPTMSPSKIMRYIKGKSSRKRMMEFKHIQKQYWGRNFWARGYFVASSDNVTDEAIAEYICGTRRNGTK